MSEIIDSVIGQGTDLSRIISAIIISVSFTVFIWLFYKIFKNLIGR